MKLKRHEKNTPSKIPLQFSFSAKRKSQRITVISHNAVAGFLFIPKRIPVPQKSIVFPSRQIFAVFIHPLQALAFKDAAPSPLAR